MKGETWNESCVGHDEITLRPVRRITTAGQYNITPTYHTGTAFSADGKYLLFATARQGRSYPCKAHVPTGDITALTDPIDGMGGRNELHLMTAPGRSGVGDGRGVSMSTALGPRSHWAVFMAGRALRAANLDSLKERTLIADIGPRIGGQPSIDPTEQFVLLPVTPAHPEIEAGRRVTKSYGQAFADGGMKVQLLQVPIAGGEVQTVYEEEGISSFHVQHCPNDPDLLLMDRDVHFGARKDVTNRIWTLRLSTGELTELPPLNEKRFQVHSTWTSDGEAVLYHGPGAGGGWYIGAIDKSGRVIREYAFTGAAHYGHVTAMPGGATMILDGNVAEGMLLWLDYDDEAPRLRVIARHDTDLGAMPWQYPHPHPQADPTGRWISFNAVRRRPASLHCWACETERDVRQRAADNSSGRARSDVYVVDVGDAR